MTTEEWLPFLTGVGDNYYHRNERGQTCRFTREDSDYWGTTLGQVQIAGFFPCPECRPDETDQEAT